jgi:hypothetical protein
LTDTSAQSEPSPEAKSPKVLAGWKSLFIAVIYPLGVILFELSTQFCAERLFDPIPTAFHKILVILVPAFNLVMWLKLRNKIDLPFSRVMLFGAISIGINAFYTLLFLPLLPLSVMAILMLGMGFLSLAPLFSFIASIKIYRTLKRQAEPQEVNENYIWKGLAISLVCLLLLDIPASATFLGMKLTQAENRNTQQLGLSILRNLGDEDLMLRATYTGNRRAGGPLSLSILMFDDTHVNSEKAREIFYQVTGIPFNQKPIPHKGGPWARYQMFAFDNNLASSDVGGRVANLELESSSLDGSVNAEQGFAYLEWTLSVKNNSLIQREARMQIQLPKDAVVSRASLWINGEEKEAAYAKTAQVRQAYQSVVNQRRDPLLVTYSGKDRVMAQAFPIMPDGGRIKFKLGMTIPLQFTNIEQTFFALPTIIERNFSIPVNAGNQVWIESSQLISSDMMDAKKVGSNITRIQGQVPLKAGQPIVVKALRSSKQQDYLAQLSDSPMILQQLQKVKSAKTDSLHIVLDGSKGTQEHIESIINGLKAIPLSQLVSFEIAALGGVFYDAQPWSDTYLSKVIKAIKSHEFAGGEDNIPALVNALLNSESYTRPSILWIHGSQPVAFSNSKARIEQALRRISRIPDIHLLALNQSPNEVLKYQKFSQYASNLALAVDTKTRLHHFFKSMTPGTAKIEMKRVALDNQSAQNADSNGSEHIVRLWAAAETNRLLRAKNSTSIESTSTFAASYKIITPVSGAVVLENQQQYEDNALTPVEKSSVPTIPEPEQWALIILLLISGLWVIRKKRLAH